MADILRKQLEQYNDIPTISTSGSKPERQPPTATGANSTTTATATSVPASSSNANSSPSSSSTTNLPKGVVLGPDGKPCRSCTSAAAWKTLMRQSKGSSPATAAAAAATTTTTTTPMASTEGQISPATASDCPPDVEQLGRSSWTLLHTMAANYPDVATTEQQSDMRNFLHFFTKLYPCWVCGTGFQKWMVKNPPPLEDRKGFGNWMCQAHNVVNRRLGKKEFDCRFWEQRWKDGWEDGRCD